MNRTKELVAAALDMADRPYVEDVVDEVLGIIEGDSNLLAEYWGIINDGKKVGKFLLEEGDINPLISDCVRRLTGGTTSTSGHPCKKNTLARTYSKMIY